MNAVESLVRCNFIPVGASLNRTRWVFQQYRPEADVHVTRSQLHVCCAINFVPDMYNKELLSKAAGLITDKTVVNADR